MREITHQQATRDPLCRKYLREAPRCQEPNCEGGRIASIVTLRGQLFVPCGNAWHLVRWRNCDGIGDYRDGKRCGMCLTCAPEDSTVREGLK